MGRTTLFIPRGGFIWSSTEEPPPRRERARERERESDYNQSVRFTVCLRKPWNKRGYTLPPFSSFLQPPGRIENSKVPIGRPQPPREEEIRPTRGRAKGMSTRHQTKTNRVDLCTLPATLPAPLFVNRKQIFSGSPSIVSLFERSNARMTCKESTTASSLVPPTFFPPPQFRKFEFAILKS